MTVAIIGTAVLAALVFVLGFNVSRMRGVTAKAGGQQLPTDPSDPLFKAIRAHGNAAEYVPTLIVLFLLVGSRSPAVVATVLIAGATGCRLLHAYAMLSAPSLATRSKPRELGAIGTYVFGLALAVTAAVSLL